MLPKKLISRLHSFLSTEDFEQAMRWYDEDRLCSFRVNTLKSTTGEVESFLYSKNIPFTKVPFLSLAYTLSRKDEFALKGSPLFYEGKIYMQGLASQIPATVLDIRGGMRILDVTAAPGSKTTQIAAIMNNTGTIVACEKHQIRYDKLVHNIRTQGATNIDTYKTDALKLMAELEKQSFDAILLDAPCSAEGRIKLSDERTYGFWSLKNIQEKAAIQTGLLEASIPLLKKWGVLVYSTCTLAPEENEGIVSSILAKYPDLQPEEIETVPFARKGLTGFEWHTYDSEIEKTVRILPSDMMEGFYVAKMRKI